MRLLLQRVSSASVTVEGEVTGAIGPGILALVGLGHGDGEDLFAPALEKITNLRIFPDEDGKMNRSLLDSGGGLLLVSQFTLYADCRKGRRPSYTDAMAPGEAEALFEKFFNFCHERHPGPVANGRFGAMMQVSLVNEGPVTIWIDSTAMNWRR